MTVTGDSGWTGTVPVPAGVRGMAAGYPVREQKVSARGQATVNQAGRDVIVGDVFVGRFARLRDKWLDPASVFADVQVERFTGRAWLLEPMDRFLARHDHGHVIVEADAGLGKSALAAWLAYSRGWPCHFTRISNGSVSSTALSNLGVQLIVKYQLNDQYTSQGILPETAGEPGWFEQVLRAAADAARADGGRIVIVVDGLDEAEVVKGALPLGLPALLPQGAFIVATCRTGTDLLALRQPYELLKIKPRNRHNASDLELFLRTMLTEDAEMAALLSASDANVGAVTARILDRCGGVWIYLRYVLNELREGLRSVEDIDLLPGDLSAYYAESLLAGRRDPDWGRLRLPLLATLAVAAEPLSVPALTRLAGLPDPHPVQVLCDGPLLPFLAVSPGEQDGLLRFSVYHASLREFLTGSGPDTFAGGGREQAEELARAAVDAHARMANYYLAAFGGLDRGLPALAADPLMAQIDEGYALRHLTEHLEQAGRAGDVDALITCEQPVPARGSVWYAAHERAGTLDEYRADLDRARRQAAARTDRAVRLGRKAPSLSLELRYILIDSAVKTLTVSVPTTLIGRLVQSGLWSPARALFAARQHHDEATRAGALAVLCPYLPEDDRKAVIQDAITLASRAAGAYTRAWAFAKLLQESSGALPDEVSARALGATAEISAEEDRAEILRWLAETLPAPFAAQAADMAASISDEEKRVQILDALIPELPETALPEILEAVPAVTDSGLRAQLIVTLASTDPADLTGELTDAARNVPADHARAWALAAVARMTPQPDPDLADEALATARVTADPADRAQALSLIADLFGDRRAELLDEALAAASAADDDYDRFWARVVVAQSLPSSRRRVVLNEVLKEALAYPAGPGRLDRLAFLAPYLSNAQVANVVPVILAIQPESDKAELLELYAPFLPDQLFETALRAAADIRDESWLAGVIRTLAPHIPGRLLAEALSVTRRITSVSLRNDVIAEFADRLPESLLELALSLGQSTASGSGDSRVLCAAALRAQEPRRTQLLREALATARSITGDFARAQALGDIAVGLEEAEREQVMAEAVHSAKSYPDEYRRMYALDSLIPLLASKERKLAIVDAIAMTRAMSDITYKVEWLAVLARYVPRQERPAVLAEALEIARSTNSEPERRQALTDIAIAFPGDARMDAYRELLTLIKSDPDHTPPAARLWQEVAEVLPDRLILTVLELMRRASYEDTPPPDSTRLLKYVPNRLIEKALDIFRDNPFGLHNAHALGTMALYVPTRFRQQVINLALAAGEGVVARRAILTQARSLWKERITTAELEIFRQTITDIGLDEYLNVLASGADIVAQVAGTQSLDDFLTDLRTIQRWWPPSEGT